MDPELRDALQQLREQVDSSARRTDERLDAAEQRTREHVEKTVAESRRHFAVLAEDLRGEIRQVAEAVGALSVRGDRLEVDLREEILRSQREMSAMIRCS